MESWWNNCGLHAFNGEMVSIISYMQCAVTSFLAHCRCSGRRCLVMSGWLKLLDNSLTLESSLQCDPLLDKVVSSLTVFSVENPKMTSTAPLLLANSHMRQVASGRCSVENPFWEWSYMGKETMHGCPLGLRGQDKGGVIWDLAAEMVASSCSSLLMEAEATTPWAPISVVWMWGLFWQSQPRVLSRDFPVILWARSICLYKCILCLNWPQYILLSSTKNLDPCAPFWDSQARAPCAQPVPGMSRRTHTVSLLYF